jgi:hypothetical protein
MERGLLRLNKVQFTSPVGSHRLRCTDEVAAALYIDQGGTQFTWEVTVIERGGETGAWLSLWYA